MIYNKKTSNETYLDTIYAGCSVGSYSALNVEDYTISGKALTDCTVLKLEYVHLERMRCVNDDLDANITEYEQYVEENGLPYCDYKLHRGNGNDITGLEKFQNGINRIMRIIKSYKASTFTDLLNKVQEQVKKDRSEKLKRWRMRSLKSQPQNFEDKMEKMMIEQSQKIHNLSEIIENQNMLIRMLSKNSSFACKHCGKQNSPDDV